VVTERYSWSEVSNCYLDALSEVHRRGIDHT
jgi:hypothetical protein